MAMTINSSPVLKGETAKYFVEEADRNSNLPTPQLTERREEELKEMDRRSKEFIKWLNLI